MDIYSERKIQKNGSKVILINIVDKYSDLNGGL